ncbi:hypothetical protein ACFQ6V_03585 [Streptomyces roseifaciens]
MSTSPAVSPRYLGAAAEAGLLHRLDGRPYVVGETHDPLHDRHEFLVEYCAEELLADARGLERALEAAGGRALGTAVVTVRVPGGIRLPEPWRPHLTYLTHAGPPPRNDAAPSPFTVRPADAETDTPAVARWIAKALADGSADQGDTAAPAAVNVLVREFLDAPDRFSYVACRDGRPVGHATLLCDAHDPVTGRDHVELVDVLVEETDEEQRTAVDALTAAAIAHAHRAALPLTGHVVHPAPHIAPERGERIVASLVARGWAVDHVFWQRHYGKDGV